MTKLSAADKRRILRERRAKKLASSASDRLTKIAGINSPFDDEIKRTDAEDTKKQPSFSDPKISVPENDDNDKYTTDLSDLKVSDPLHGNGPQEDIDPFGNTKDETEMDQFLKNMLGSLNHSELHSHDNGSNPLPEDLMNKMSAILKNAGDGDKSDKFSSFANNLRQAGQKAEDEQKKKTPEEIKQENIVNEYNKYTLTKLKIWTTFARYLITLFLVYWNIYGVESYTPSFDNLRPFFQDSKRSFFHRLQFWKNGDLILRNATTCRFWNYFVFFEVIASIFFYLMRSKFNRPKPNMLVSILTGVIPAKYGRIITAVMGQSELIGLCISDFSLVIVALGLITYFTTK